MNIFHMYVSMHTTTHKKSIFFSPTEYTLPPTPANQLLEIVMCNIFKKYSKNSFWLWAKVKVKSVGDSKCIST